MGIYADILNNAKTIDTGGPDGVRVAEDKAITRILKGLMAAQGDRDYPTGYESRNEIQQIAQHQGTVTGGTFTLSFTLESGFQFTTANIAHNANAATIQSAINTAAASVPGWTNGDIVVGGGPLTSGAITLTYSGNSVKSLNHGQATINGAGMTGGGSAGAPSTTTQGQTNRTAWAVLNTCGAVSGTPPVQGTAATVTAPTNRQSNPHLPDQDTLRALAHEATVEDKNATVETEILKALGL